MTAMAPAAVVPAGWQTVRLRGPTRTGWRRGSGEADMSNQRTFTPSPLGRCCGFPLRLGSGGSERSSPYSASTGATSARWAKLATRQASRTAASCQGTILLSYAPAGPPSRLRGSGCADVDVPEPRGCLW